MLATTLTPRLAVISLVLGCLFSTNLQGQQKPASITPTAAWEFPVLLLQNVTAGKTAAGSKIQGTLEVATLVDGTVIPRNAMFSGEVIESVAKSKTEPSRVAIRMNSVQWKDGSASAKLYLTAWIYPEEEVNGQNLRYGPEQSAKGTWNGQGQYPDPNSKSYKPFPGSDAGKEPGAPDTPSATTSHHRVLMKDVETTTGTDGTLALVSRRSNIKLDKLTTYVFSASDLLPPKAPGAK